MAGGVAAPRSIRIDGLRRTVSDLQRSIDFYCGALGFERLGRLDTPPMARTARLRLGDQHIDLVVHADAAPLPAAATAPDPRFQHAAIVTADMEAAFRRLAPYAAACITRGGPQRLPAHTGGVTAFKFRDPDGHPLELIQFPAGVGDPRWQVPRAGGPTLGIDHFALVVEDVDRSIAFFTAQLGLQVTGRDISRGGEQDRLDGLDGVVVDVVSLAPILGPGTPHLELLGYRQPTRPAPIREWASALQPNAVDEIVCIREPRSTDGPDAHAVRLHDPDGHRFIVLADPA